MLSEKERAILLLLFKDFGTEYNARSISGKVGMTPRGALKALKNLEEQDFVTSSTFGRAIRYKFNFASALAKKTLELFLLEDAELRHRRWLMEFRSLTEAHILLLFGSAARKEKGYNDIDLVVVVAENKYDRLVGKIKEKQEIMVKRIHAVWQSPNDLRNNLRKRDAVMIDAVKTGVVLKGQAELVEVVESVTGS